MGYFILRGPTEEETYRRVAKERGQEGKKRAVWKEIYFLKWPNPNKIRDAWWWTCTEKPEVIRSWLPRGLCSVHSDVNYCSCSNQWISTPLEARAEIYICFLILFSSVLFCKYETMDWCARQSIRLFFSPSSECSQKKMTILDGIKMSQSTRYNQYK